VSTVLLHSVDIAIPGYRILRPIGEGGMASVFLAVQESLDREVALKVMAPALAANTEFTDRFLKEGRITAKLQHQNLVTVFDIGTHAGIYYLAAEYIPGGTLKERITAGGLTTGEILDIAVDVARGLDFAHGKGFVHRDVKPGNILFRNDGSVVLADFGIAKAMDNSSSSTVAGASIGTPDYMSPEQARAETVDGRSDLYSLGTVLFEMLTGNAPYQASDPFTVALMHVTHPLPKLPADLAWLQPLIDKMMAKQPAERYQNGAEFIAGAHKLLASAPEASGALSRTASKSANRIAPSTIQRTRVVNREEGARPRWLWPVVTLAAALVIGFGTWAVFRPTPKAAVDDAPRTVVPTQQAPLPQPQVDPNDLGNNGVDANGIKVPKTLEEQLGGDVGQWLTQAESYKQYGLTSATEPGRHLVDPEDDSAVGFYRKVLAAQPDNQQAKKGMQEIAAYYLKFAKRLCDRGDFATCKMETEYGLAAEPDNSELKQLASKADAGSRELAPSGN
jgi:hypothetical protein